MKIFKWLRDNAVVILLGVLFFSPILVVMGLNFLEQDREIRELRQEIANRELELGFNEDYVAGWNDCISFLKHIRTRATNCTVANID